MLLVLTSWAAFAAADGKGPLLEGDTGLMAEPVEEPAFVPQAGRASRPCKTPLSDWAQLPDGSGLLKRWDPQRAWGTTGMIDTLILAAEEVAWGLPGADPLVVGDISVRGGGYLDGHRSHRTGLDADVGIYKLEGIQDPTGFADVRTREFDAEANWLVIETMLSTDRIDRILLDHSHIQLLKRYLHDNEILSQDEIDEIFLGPRDFAEQYWRMRTGVIHHAPGHKGHFHVRVLCGT